ncbi:Uncharacterized protein MCB1EB_1569 [Mycoavidus cysteinexigens]|uniref:Uncharacterized protein n=1 Tax=Mycoavidus cysteinexigens TaxID=1553431 RepID=A0A2Z6EW98_9BURK|nr:hypothetical protein [Mycoavidus cysteinexigens]BBE09730.1 Uncharacterized protein MCB1EB_1569 [Mycoavidus cysteinexigens]GAM51546.1 phage-related protein [bacterium endosymbiont of Mortierella elongata FMR23-6]GLR01405.1 hypothetical protein GCM10007934_12170 [Mycoavidus cysteinexigens]
MKVRRLDANHDWTFGQGRANYATLAESVAQRVKSRLLSFQGDWFLDLEHGLPWLPHFERPADLRQIEHLVKRTILHTHGVRELLNLELEWDASTRRLTITAQLKNHDDQLINITN